MPEPMFTDCELAEMAACVEDTLPDTARIERLTRTRDNAGGGTGAWSTVATVPCLVLPDTAPGEEDEAARLTSLTFWKVQMPLGADARPEDRLTISGRIYHVDNTDAGRSFAVSVMARCRRQG